MGKSLTAIVIGLGSAGDVHPNVGLALALRERGHDVLLLAPSVFRELAARTGLSFLGLMDEKYFQETLDHPDLWHPLKSFGVVARRLILPAMRPIYEIIRERFRPGHTVVAAPAFAFGARIANEKLGVPLATVHLQPIVFRSTEAPGCFGFPDLLAHMPRWMRSHYYGAVDRFIVDPLLAKETNRFRRELGLSPISRFFNEWFHSPDCVIGMFPEWFAPPASGWPPNLLLPGFPLWDERQVREPSQELRDFLAEGESPIVFTAGSAMKQARRFFHVSAEVCRAMRRRGLLLTQYPEQLPSQLPPGVRHFDYIPFSAVLPHAAAFVHHGGIGTTSQALAAGVPQLVVPLSHDQPDNGVRVQRLGVGDFVLPFAYRTSKVIARLARLMTPEVRERCRLRAADVAQNDALAATARCIEELGTTRT